jgi:CelD/BcsL family acetyltransferase involved in cellulose biosynthesis
MAYSVSKIESINDFRDLKSRWDQFVKDKKLHHPFLEHDWFELWFEHFKDKHKLLILILKDEDEMKAMCPLMLTDENIRGFLVKKIELIGNIYSPIRNILFANQKNKEMKKSAQVLFSFLAAQNDWDIMDLNSLPEEDFEFEMIHDVLREVGLKQKEYFCFHNCYLDNITYSGKEFFNNRPKVIRKDIPYCQRRLGKMGHLEFKLVDNDTTIDRYMDYYYEVYSNSWQQSEDVGPSFHRDLAKLAAHKGTLRLGFLFLDNAPIASQFWLVSNKTAYILKTVYDQKLSKFSPGKILTLQMFMNVIDIDKVAQIDFLYGDDPYKKDWVHNTRARKGILIFNNTIKGRLLAILMLNVLPVVNSSRFLKPLKGKLSDFFHMRTKMIRMLKHMF